jgi:hypothetical protein
MSRHRYYLSLPETAQFNKTDAPRRFLKDVIRAGQFFVPHMGIWLDVDTKRIDDWVTQFSRMHANGVNVPLTIDHAQTADAVRGSITRLFRQGDELMMECEVPDDDSAALLARCPHVSLELEKKVKDGTGASYDEAVTAVTITPKPVVPDQQPFQRIAASRDGAADPSGKNDVVVLRLTAIKDPQHKGAPLNPARSTPMPVTLTAEQATALMTALGISGVPDDQVAGKLVEGVTGLATKVKGHDTTIASLNTELTTVKASLTEAGKAKMPEIDVDALEEAADSTKTKLGLLVEKAKITPAVKAKLEGIFLGSDGKRPAICLSRKAAAHAGLPAPIARAVIEALEDNDAAALSKTLGEKAGPQTVRLSRDIPDGGDAPDKDSVSNMLDAAFGPATTK